MRLLIREALVSDATSIAKVHVDSWIETYKNIVETRGYKELFLRGLKTRIIIHGLQNMFFILVWKNLEKAFNI